jgi:hypothetical protein
MGKAAMTEARWLRSRRPRDLFAFLEEIQASERKLRLFAVACSRRCNFNKSGDGEREETDAENLSERFADGLATPHELARRKSWWVADSKGLAAARFFAETKLSVGDLKQGGKAAIFREVFGNPFREVRFDPALRTPAVASLATAAYEERLTPSFDLDPVRLSILADALEDASCSNEDLIAHLRSSGPHVRGCWAVDVILGKG